MLLLQATAMHGKLRGATRNSVRTAARCFIQLISDVTSTPFTSVHEFLAWSVVRRSVVRMSSDCTLWTAILEASNHTFSITFLEHSASGSAHVNSHEIQKSGTNTVSDFDDIFTQMYIHVLKDSHMVHGWL